MGKSSFRDKVSKDSQRQQKAATSYGHLLLPKGINVFSPEPGSKIKLDFIPYIVSSKVHPDRDTEFDIAVEGTQWFKRPYRLHRSIGINNDSEVCLSSMGKKCPICEYRAKRIREGAEKEETDAMRASLRNLYVVIPIDSNKYEEKLHIFDISQFLFQNLLNEEIDENADYAIFPDLDEGLTLRIRFESRSIGNSQPFAEASRIDFLKRDEAYDKEILKEVPDLDKVLKVLSYEELQAKFFEIEGDDHDDDDKDDDDAHTETTHTFRRKKTAVPEKETDVDADADDDEDNKETEELPRTPARTRRTTTPKETTEDRCPHGHRFGIDAEKFDECDTCEIWSDCLNEKRKAK